MKDLIRATVFTGLFSMAFLAVNAQIYVNVRPARPVVIERTPAPSNRHVWVEEEWVPQGNTYVWHGGYWAAPPRERAVFVRGHWRHSRRGDVWVPAHWR